MGDDPRMTGVTGGLLRLLRLETAEEHARLEAHELVRPLQSAGLDEPAYARFLRVFHGYYEALEGRLEPALRDFGSHLPNGYRYVARRPALAGDLEDLDVPLSGGRSPHPRLPEMNGPAELLGVLYVVEGSTLGGRVLAPRITQQLALVPGRATRYLHLYETADWPILRRWLETTQPGADFSAIGAAARDTFRTLREYLDHDMARQSGPVHGHQ